MRMVDLTMHAVEVHQCRHQRTRLLWWWKRIGCAKWHFVARPTRPDYNGKKPSYIALIGVGLISLAVYNSWPLR